MIHTSGSVTYTHRKRLNKREKGKEKREKERKIRNATPLQGGTTNTNDDDSCGYKEHYDIEKSTK